MAALEELENVLLLIPNREADPFSAHPIFKAELIEALTTRRRDIIKKYQTAKKEWDAKHAPKPEAEPKSGVVISV